MFLAPDGQLGRVAPTTGRVTTRGSQLDATVPTEAWRLVLVFEQRCDAAVRAAAVTIGDVDDLLHDAGSRRGSARFCAGFFITANKQKQKSNERLIINAENECNGRKNTTRK